MLRCGWYGAWYGVGDTVVRRGRYGVRCGAPLHVRVRNQAVYDVIRQHRVHGGPAVAATGAVVRGAGSCGVFDAINLSLSRRIGERVPGGGGGTMTGQTCLGTTAQNFSKLTLGSDLG